MRDEKTVKKPLHEELRERVAALREDVRRFVSSENRKRANGNDDRAEDQTQAALLGIAESIESYREDAGSLTKWGLGVAGNVVRQDERARRRLEARRSAEEFDADGVPSTELSPERAAHLADVRRKIAAAVETMPEHLFAVFLLVGILGHSHAEAADKLGISEATAKKRLERARDHIVDKSGVRRDDLRPLLAFLPWEDDAEALRLLRWRMLLGRAFHGGLAVIIAGGLALPCHESSGEHFESAQHLPELGRVTIAADAAIVPDEPLSKRPDPSKPAELPRTSRATSPRPARAAVNALRVALGGLDHPPSHGQ